MSAKLPPPRPDGTEVPTRDYSIGAHAFTAPKAAPGLYLVATPIGNLGDISIRALETLAGADLIACEDTRVTQRLLERYGIRAPLTPYHEHNAVAARPKLMGKLAQGGSVALVSDAGTPLISDPGFKLAREVRDIGFNVTTIPGASSVLAALTLAGLPTDRFFFDGFLPSKPGARKSRIEELSRIDASLVVFESGSRIAESVADLAAGLGPRVAAICRELTKLHEQVLRGPLDELAAGRDTLETRGEFVVVIAPPTTTTMSAADVDTVLREALRDHSLKDAVALATEASGRPRREIYARALELGKAGKANDEATDDKASDNG
jgi:16S rRNA (cytidine1402-2'-O)-methyltransferase